MDAKEKAKELYCKYTDALNIRDLQTTANPFAKQCALIAVDEILETTFMKALFIHWKFIDVQEISTTDYWIEVKQEIKKL